MSYDLLVYTSSIPDGLRDQWPAAIARSGLIAEVSPEFDPAKPDGYVAWKVSVADPEAFRFASNYGTKPVEAGFELLTRDSEFEPDDWKTAAPDVVERVEEASQTWVFSNPHGGKPADLRLQWFAAATLAQLADGVLLDPQEDQSFLGEAALAEAAFQADKFEEEQRDDWTESTAFEGW